MIAYMYYYGTKYRQLQTSILTSSTVLDTLIFSNSEEASYYESDCDIVHIEFVNLLPI